MNQFTCKEVKHKIYSLMKEGVLDIESMKTHIGLFVKNEMFRGEEPPPEVNRRYWPKDEDYRNYLNKYKEKLKLAKFDQDNMALLVENGNQKVRMINFFSGAMAKE